jgi:hypothetical protein
MGFGEAEMLAIAVCPDGARRGLPHKSKPSSATHRSSQMIPMLA